MTGDGRICTRCGEWRPWSDFYADAAKPSGHKPWCKTCCNRQQKDAGRYTKWYWKDPEHSRELKRTVAKNNPVVRDRKNEEGRARSVLDKAVKRGDVVRPAVCELCGAECKPEGHHEDYSQPLAVQWLCCRCHKGVHRALSTLR
jgi:hypothetical protein